MLTQWTRRNSSGYLLRAAMGREIAQDWPATFTRTSILGTTLDSLTLGFGQQHSSSQKFETRHCRPHWLDRDPPNGNPFSIGGRLEAVDDFRPQEDILQGFSVKTDSSPLGLVPKGKSRRSQCRPCPIESSAPLSSNNSNR